MVLTGNCEVAVVSLGGDVYGNEASVLPKADLYVGVDSGALHLLEFGLPVDVVVGDLDSLKGRILPKDVPLWIMTNWDKDTTDSDLALDLLYRSGVSYVYLLGIAGFEIDHVLGNLALFRRWHGRFSSLIGVVGRQWFFRLEGEVRLHVSPGTIFSIVPDFPSVFLTVKGAKWELDRVEWSFADVPPISNIAEDNLVYVKVERGSAFVFIGRQS